MPNGIRKSRVVRLVRRTEIRVEADDLMRAWGRSRGRALDLVPLDRAYFAVPWETWNLILAYTAVDAGEYQTDRYDCDDFAVALKAAVSRKLALNGVGLVIDWSGRHAYAALIVADSDGAVRIVFAEPQTDRVVYRSEGMYAAKSGMAIF